MWLQILSELFVNFAAAWFATTFIEIQVANISTLFDFLSLIFRITLGILSLVFAKTFREKSKT